MKSRTCIEDILIRGLADWIQAAEVASVARELGGARSETEAMDISIQIVRELLEHELAVVGVISNSKFLPYSRPVEDVERRIRREWQALPSGPDLGDMFWLKLTNKGIAQGKYLLSQEGME